MGSNFDKIARSPTPPETDDDGEEWPVHGIVGEDIDVFGISRCVAAAIIDSSIDHPYFSYEASQLSFSFSPPISLAPLPQFFF